MRLLSESKITADTNGHGSKPRTPSEHHPIPTKIGSRMGGAPIPKWDLIGFEPWPNLGDGGIFWQKALPQRFVEPLPKFHAPDLK